MECETDMNVTLWIVQAVLAVAFGLAGGLKATQPREKLVKSLPWVQDVSDGTLRLIGVAEFAAALGLILPAVTGIAVWLTPLAACGIALIMVLAAGGCTRAARSPAPSPPTSCCSPWRSSSPGAASARTPSEPANGYTLRLPLFGGTTPPGQLL